MFKELKMTKDGMPGKDEMIKHLETEIKDETWKTVFKASIDKCHKELTANKDKIISEMEKAPLNLKKDQCNVLPLALLTCFHLYCVSVRTCFQNIS